MTLETVTLDFVYLVIAIMGELFTWMAGLMIVMVFVESLVTIMTVLRK